MQGTALRSRERQYPSRGMHGGRGTHEWPWVFPVPAKAWGITEPSITYRLSAWIEAAGRLRRDAQTSGILTRPPRGPGPSEA